MVCRRDLVGPRRLRGHVLGGHGHDQFAGGTEEDPAALAWRFAPRMRTDRLEHPGPNPHCHSNIQYCLMADHFEFGGEFAWHPTPEYRERSRLKEFISRHGLA